MRTASLIPVLMLCVVAVSCGTTGGIVADGPPGAYADAETRFLLKDYRGALDKFESFLDGDPSSRYVSDAHYWAGVSALELGERGRARAHVERAYARTRTRFLKGLCLAALGDCDFATGEFRSAVGNYRRALEYPGTQKARILLRVGDSYRRLGRAGTAETYFRRVVNEYPGSVFAAQAKARTIREERTGSAGGEYSVQAGAFGDRDNAEDLRFRLEKRNFPAHLRLLSREGKVLYSVRVGRYDMQDRAEAIARRMRAAGFDAVVIP